MRLEDMMKDCSAREILLATHMGSGRTSNLDDYFHEHEDEFFKELYASAKNEVDLFERLNRRMDSHYDNIVILSGVKGCGKTTFVSKYLNQLQGKDYIRLNFDRVGGEDPIAYTLFFYLYNAILDDIKCSDGILCQQLLDIWDNGNTKECFDRKIDKHNQYNEFMKYLKQIKNGNINNIEDLSSKLKIDHLGKMSTEQMLFLIILWDLAKCTKRKNLKKCIIVFDNLDVVYNNDILTKFTLEFSQFVNDAAYIFRKVQLPFISNEQNPFNNYCMLFVMRETTKAEFIEHFADRKLIAYPLELGKVYNKKEIIDKRYQFADKCKEFIKKDEYNKIKLIKELLQDSYVEDYIFKLFNDDIRTSMETLCEICFNENYLQECIDLRDNKQKLHNLNKADRSYGARGIMFAEIFCLFEEKKYFSLIKESEYGVQITKEMCQDRKRIMINENDEDIDISLSAKTISRLRESDLKWEENDFPQLQQAKCLVINITRILLLYLLNSKRDFEHDYYTTVRLKTLFSDIQELVIENDKEGEQLLQITINSLWNMFELRTKPYWNHLITFDGLKEITLPALKQQLDIYKKNENYFSNYAAVSITSGGYFYLRIVLTHFEYFSARAKNNNKYYMPLFLEQTLTKFDNKTYIFQKIIESEFEEVKECWEKLYAFYRVIFEGKNRYQPEEFLNSKYVFYNMADGSLYSSGAMYHIERIVHAHVSYLDTYRRFAIAVLDKKDDASAEKIQNEQKSVNKIIIQYIMRYLHLLDFENREALLSKRSRTLISYYLSCIESIVNSDYLAYYTRIDRETGAKLQGRDLDE